MLNDEKIKTPPFYQTIHQESQTLGFNMLSDLQTGSFLRTLASSKPGGRMLELGTGTGLSLTWLAEGADSASTLISVDNSEVYQNVARKVLGSDSRITFHCQDGNEWLKSYQGSSFDLVFADAWPGKFENLEKALEIVKVGGFYLIDDLRPQPNWPTNHEANVEKLLHYLEQRTDFVSTTLNWSTGLVLMTRIKGK